MLEASLFDNANGCRDILVVRTVAREEKARHEFDIDPDPDPALPSEVASFYASRSSSHPHEWDPETSSDVGHAD